MTRTVSRQWPPAPGDYEVGNPELPVAVCTLGKKIAIPAPCAIVGTCKTENIGIERVIVNVVSNPNIRYFVLAGPEIPGHRTGSSLRSLYHNGIDPDTKKIIDAPGAIPYIENIPLEAVERFRRQVEFVDMMNVSDPDRIAVAVRNLLGRGAEPYPEEPLWIEFVRESRTASKGPRDSISVIPEFDVSLDPGTSALGSSSFAATVTVNPSRVVIEIHADDDGLMFLAKED
ncbi:MAG: tetrahydromethanopterin S-methyltransferase subunit A [Candidatus Thorarchaeota archaeon]